MKKITGLGLIVAAMLAINGCSTMDKAFPLEGAKVDERKITGAGSTDTAALGGDFSGHALDDPNSPLSQKVFYFDLNSAEISMGDRNALMAHASYLIENPEVSIVAEGHADERGSREYNLALGERRGKAIEQLLLIQGVNRNQIQVISYGEERSAVMGHGESSWRQNRRVELRYSGY
ncbi:MAG: peptidoglycan-associated lipoprotein Pal [Gammaproteobacteria bacterium]|nr:peptidoglycan-associated lipoprotein Pal [Gammaproteobacteria bacterium]